MKNKINVAEILRDCPRDMELDCVMYNNLYFNQIYNDDGCVYKIGCYTIANGTITTVDFTEFGEFNTHTNSKCVIFPKGKTTWEGFVPPCKFKDGDVVVAENKANVPQQLFLLKCVKYREDNNGYDGYCYFGWDFHDNRLFEEGTWGFNRLATEEEKEKLFDTIKTNGYRWDEETKTLTKLIKPKFIVGDVIKDIDAYKVKITEINMDDGCYSYESIITKGIGSIPFNEQDNWELYHNKFDINTLIPFESKVLVRDYDGDMWKASFWGCLMNSKSYFNYDTTRGCYKQCIPYEGNEHLLGKTDDCVEYYKNWK